jgi:3-deoxy-7-phosphoheptulonate synthase
VTRREYKFITDPLMIVAMQEAATEEQIQQVIAHLVGMGFTVHRSTGARQTVVAAVGARADFDIRNLEVFAGVQEVHRISAPYKLAGRSFRPQGTIVTFANGVKIGGPEVVVIAGPCSVESRQQLFTVAELVAKRAPKACAAALSSRAVRRIVFRVSAWKA